MPKDLPTLESVKESVLKMEAADRQALEDRYQDLDTQPLNHRNRPPLTDEQRRTIGQNLKRGREEHARRRRENGGELHDSPYAPPTIAEVRQVLAAITDKWLKDNTNHTTLPLLTSDLTTALQAAQIADQRAMALRIAEGCSICGRPFPNGRAVSERSWHDSVMNGIRTLRSCSEACTREIDRRALDFSAGRQGNQQPRRVI